MFHNVSGVHAGFAPFCRRVTLEKAEKKRTVRTLDPIMRQILNGNRMPTVLPGQLENDANRTVPTVALLAYGRALIRIAPMIPSY